MFSRYPSPSGYLNRSRQATATDKELSLTNYPKLNTAADPLIKSPQPSVTLMITERTIHGCIRMQSKCS